MIKLKNILNEGVSSELKKLEQLMKYHDWYYEMSDDQNTWRIGRSNRLVINKMIMQLNSKGSNMETEKLLKKYKPKPMGAVSSSILVPAPKRPKK